MVNLVLFAIGVAFGLLFFSISVLPLLYALPKTIYWVSKGRLWAGAVRYVLLKFLVVNFLLLISVALIGAIVPSLADLLYNNAGFFYGQWTGIGMGLLYAFTEKGRADLNADFWRMMRGRNLKQANQSREIATPARSEEQLSAAKSLGNLGVLYRKSGEFAKALECSKAALNIFRKVGDQESEATELLLQANTYGLMKDYTNAFDCHMQSIKISDDLENELLVAMNCLRVGLLMAAAAMYTESRIMLRYAALLYSNLGEKKYFADASSAMKQFRVEGLFSSDPQEIALDGFFSAGSSLESIRRAVDKHPLLAAPSLISRLDNANELTVGIRCVVLAIKKRVSMLRHVALD